jgi:phosphatidylglycerol lysyltransferase
MVRYAAMRHKTLRSLGSVISVCLFMAAIAVIHHKLRGYHLHDIVREIDQVPTGALLLSLVLTAVNYLVLTASDALALKYVRHPLAYHKIALASFIGYVFSSNATVIGGSAARYRIYSALGVSAGEMAELVLFCGVTFWLGFLALAGTVFIVQPLPTPGALHLPFGSTWLIGVIFLAFVGTYLLAVILRRRPLVIRGWELEIPSMTLAAGQLLVSALDWLLATAVLYVLLPAGMQPPPATFLAIFMLAQGIGMTSYIPGGLGVFETVVLLLMADEQTAALTAALLLYRLVYYILPLILASALLAIHEILPRVATIQRIGLTLGRWGSAIAPQLLAFAVFVAGAILLFSGALPPTQARFRLLRDLLPLPAIEVSHFLGSLTGAALLLLARGLQRRLDVARHITVVLLGAGMAFSLLKGLDYEEAIILGVMLAALLACHGQFYRKASLTAQRFTPGWTTLIVIVLVCSVWLGVFAYKHVDYSNSLWWRFTVRGNAPRFLRATSGAIVLVLLYAVARLLVPARPRPAGLDDAAAGKIRTIVDASPRTYANLALLGDKQFLLNDSEDAFIMYGIQGQTWVALGDPVGPQERSEELGWKFIELCDRYDGQPVFYQVDAGQLGLYANLGMTFVKLGEEARVPLEGFSLDGHERRGLRHSHNRVSKEGYRFEILPVEQVPQVLDRLKHVSDAWLQQKNTREKGFSLGFFSPAYILQCPAAVVEHGNELVAFANLWAGPRKEEMSIDLMRYLPDCPEGIMDYLFTELMFWGRQQGYQWFNLGMAPLSGLEDHVLAPLWARVGAVAFRLGEHFYNFRGLRQYKEKFNPQWQPKYLACHGGLALPRVLTNIAALISGGLTGVITK